MSGTSPERSGPRPGRLQPDWHQIADAIWLAANITAGVDQPTAGRWPADRSAAHPRDGTGPDADTWLGAVEPASTAPAAASAPLPDAVGQPVTGPAEVIEPAGSGLPGALPAGRLLARALNPFKRRVRSATEREPDAEATAEYAVDAGVWLPRYRQAQERWLGLTMIVDDGPTMSVWRPTVTAFRLLLERHGAFRSVRTFRLSGAAGSPPRLHAPNGGIRGSGELLDPAGRQLYLVVTDGHGPLWRDSAVDALLRLWGSHGPLVLVNPFPQRHWRDGNLVPRRCRLRAPHTAAATSELQVQYPNEFRNPFDPPVPAGGLAVPLVELSPRWLRWWAGLLTGPPTWLDATVHVVDPSTPPAPLDSGDALEPARAVLTFRRTATPQAFRLATLLAAAPLELPLLHRIQQILLPGSQPHHLAEVLTGRLVSRTDSGDTAFEFGTGVREALLACASRDDSARVLRTVAAHQTGRVDTKIALTNLIEAPDTAPSPTISEDTIGVARIELAVFKAMSGSYSVPARRLSDAIDAFEGRAPRSTSEVAAPAHTRGDPTMGVTGGGDIVAGQPEPEFLGGILGESSSPVPREVQTPSLQEILDGQSADQGPIVWGNVPTRNPVFTGRRALLEQLESRLRTQHVAAVLPQAVHGEGGVGKSQIAIEYAYRNRDQYDVIWWVPSERPAQILASLIELGNRLGLDVGNDVITAVPTVRAALRAGRPYGKWLLIFDNAETPDTVRDYFPDAGTGKVLITSRNQAWSTIAETLEVDVFSRPESVRLLQRRNQSLLGVDAERLAAALGDLPLAIEHASAWLHATGMAVDEYLMLLEQKRQQLAVLDLAPGYETSVAAAANVALDRLAVENPAALQLLQVCSFFAPEPIGRDIFAGVRGDMGAPELDEVLKNPSRLNQAIRDIQSYMLARVDHRSNSLQLHRLVKKVLQDSIRREQRPLMAHASHILLTGVKPGDPSDSKQWMRYQALASHLTASHAWACEDDWARDFVFNLIKFYFYWGDYSTGRDLARLVVDEWRARLGAAHPQTLDAAKWLGYYWWVLGNFDDAAAIQQENLQLYLDTVGPEDEGTIDSMGMVASTQRVSGEFEAARDLDMAAFRTARRSLGEDDPATLRAAHNLGISLRLTGEFRVARQLDADTYRRRSVVLGHDHPETLRTLNNLTIDERECGEYIRSRRMVEDNYNRYTRLFGPAHQETIRIARNLAVARRRAGDHASGYKLSEDTMNRFRDLFGSTQPDAIAAAVNFAVDLRESDDLAGARDLAARTVEDYRQTLGADHPYTLYARTNLAIVLRLLGQAEQAQEHNSAAWESLKQMLGTRHMPTLVCGINLASDLAALGRHPEAYDLDVEILERCRGLLGPRHPTTLGCALNLSFDLAALGRSAESAALFDETLAGYTQVLGADHPALRAAHAGQRANCDIDPMQF